MRLARIATTVLVSALVASTSAWSQETCKTREAKFDTVAVSPGDYVGNTTGELTGAISFRTVSVARDEAGSRVSIVALTYVDRQRGSQFDALLTAIDEPTGPGESRRRATGDLTNGTGRFAGFKGRLKLGGPLSERQFKGRLLLALCG